MGEDYRDVIEVRVEKMASLLGEPSKAYTLLSNLLDEFSDVEKGEQKETFIPGVDNIRGVESKYLTKISTEIGKHLKKRDDETALALLRYLWETEIHEERKIVCKIIGKLIKKNPCLWTDFIIDILPDIDNWSICDTLATQGLEPQTLKDPDKTLSLSDKWLGSNDLFVRRFGVVALRAFKRAPITKKVFELLDKVMEDDEHYIKKAVSWILREISKQDPMRVHEYLMCYANEEADKVTRWIIRDGMKKLPREKQEELKKRLG